MDTYSLLRQIADSWVLLAMFVFFLSVVVWAFLPSQTSARAEASMIPFRDKQTPMSCDGTCAECSLKATLARNEGPNDV